MRTVAPTAAALDRLSGIARSAGTAIMRMYCGPLEVARKQDASPVTAADFAAHAVITQALERWDSAIPIVSEEAAIPDASTRAGWRQWWLVDPLDGTKEFLSGNGEFTVNIALIEDGCPVLGVVYAPALDVLYGAARGLGSWRTEANRTPVRIYSTRWRAGEAARVVESRSHPSAALESYLQGLQVVERVQVGSSLKFCRVAEGAADLYPRLGQMMEWDAAAGDCVYRYSATSGERVSPLRYNTPTLQVPGFVLGADATDLHTVRVRHTV